MKMCVIEEQVNVVGPVIDFDFELFPKKGKTFPNLQQEIFEMVQKASLQLPLPGTRSQGQKIEMIGVLQHLLRHVRLVLRESTSKVRLSLALALEELSLNLMHKYGAAPAVLDGRMCVPFTLGSSRHAQN